MNDQEHERFEAQLRRLKPARLPEELQARLDLPPRAKAGRAAEVRMPIGLRFLRWLAPATVGVLALAALLWQLGRDNHRPPPAAGTAPPSFTADQVEINRQLLDSFEAVANLPDGEPVRLRCQQWVDAVTLRDSVRGVEVVRRMPRLEVVPVGYATY